MSSMSAKDCSTTFIKDRGTVNAAPKHSVSKHSSNIASQQFSGNCLSASPSQSNSGKWRERHGQEILPRSKFEIYRILAARKRSERIRNCGVWRPYKIDGVRVRLY